MKKVVQAERVDAAATTSSGTTKKFFM